MTDGYCKQEFQFLIGSLKTNTQSKIGAGVTKFQFLIGSLKTGGAAV